MLAALGVTLCAPASALGADTYVGGAGASDGNDCVSLSTPCATIATALAKAGAGDTVHVAPGTYQQQGITGLSIGDGKSLVAESSDPSQTSITGGGSVCQLSNGFVLIQVTGDAGRIAGFTLRDYPCFGPEVIETDHDVTIENDVFDEDQAHYDVYVGGGSPAIRHDTFVDPDPSTDVSQDGAPQAAVRLDGGPATSPEVYGSSFDGFPVSIRAVPLNASGGSTPVISGNSITTTANFTTTTDVPHGLGIEVSDEQPSIRANSVAAGTYLSTRPYQAGIRIHEGPDPAVTGATLERNLIDESSQGDAMGLSVEGTQAPVDLFGDELVSAYLSMNADVSATNVTIARVNRSIYDTDAHLTLDSSILDSGPGAMWNSIAFNAGATCDISYSRGNVSDPAYGPCGTFQSTADPGFVGPFDFHLTAGSPMIDAGNPGPPPSGALDVDGDPRALSGLSSCSAPDPGRRDIGADEYVAARLDCTRPPSTTPPPPTGLRAKAIKHCKRKLRHATKRRKKCLRKARRLPV